MEGVKRRPGRKDGDFGESLRLFRELLETVCQKMQSLRQDTKNRDDKEGKQKQQKTVSDIKKTNKIQMQLSQPHHIIGLRYHRDWEGLCSERKEDVLGEYPICFEYGIQEQIPFQKQQCEQSDHSNGDSISNQ